MIDVRLERLLARGELEAIDVELALALGTLAAGARETDAPEVGEPEVRLAIALASRAVRAGHTCLELTRAVAPAGWAPGEGTGGWPSGDALRGALLASPLVRVAGREPVAGGPVLDGEAPLVLRGDRLYLQRFDALEARLAAAVRRRLERPRFPEHPDDATHLTRLFPERAQDAAQRDAAALALTAPLTIITGGPGTGKTFTVLRLLAALLARRGDGPPPAILLLAPTGKAASRLTESVRDGLAQLPPGLLEARARAALPDRAETVHRALGVHPAHPHRPRHHAANPLPADIVVVDESSMVDLPLMARLFDAVRDDARLLLLGDADQLASVDAGAVLRDLVDAPAVAPCVARLVHSRRFRADSPLGALVLALRGDDRAAVRTALAGASRAVELATGDREAGASGLVRPAAVATAPGDAPAAVPESLRLLTARGDAVPPALLDALRTHSARLAAARTPREALELLGRWRLLTALRRGGIGADAINAALFAEQGGRLQRGTPVLIVANAPDDGLANGDLGVGWEEPDGRCVVLFPGADGPRVVSERRLPRWEPAFAMTVHKAQGSEFDAVHVLLPAAPSPILTRELLYTAVSRARRAVTLVAPDGAVLAAHAARVDRATGLRDRLAAGAP
jgi:exodeoxyribonuclease V alpha subunit